MLRRKRNVFARMGILSVALLMALGAMGTTYGLWSKTLSIISTVETGTVAIQVNAGECSDSENISCSASDNVLTVELADAAVEVEYYCNFNIANTGTIPVKIQSIDISGVPELVTANVTGVAVGDQIEQNGVAGDTVYGTVDVYLAEGASQTFIFTVTISVVQWNQYIPP